MKQQTIRYGVIGIVLGGLTTMAPAAQFLPFDPRQFALHGASDMLGSAFTQVRNLDYFVAQECSIQVPGLASELVLSWGFAGSGDLFEALPGLKVAVRQQGRMMPGVMPQDIVVQAAKVIATTKLREELNGMDVVQWLCEPETSPLKVFFVKLCLLLYTALRDRLESEQVMVEATRLLVRLSLVNDGALTTYGPANFSTLLPGAVKQSLDAYAPWLLEMLDAVWSICRAPEQEQMPQTHVAYICNDQAVANALASTLRAVQNPALRPHMVHIHAIQQGCNVLDFEAYQAQQSSGLQLPIVSVGKLEGDLATVTKKLPAPIAAAYQAALASGSHGTVMRADDGKTWLVCPVLPYKSATLKQQAGEVVRVIREYAAHRALLGKASGKSVVQQGLHPDLRHFIYKTLEGGLFKQQVLEVLQREQLIARGPLTAEQKEQLHLARQAELTTLQDAIKKAEQELRTLTALLAAPNLLAINQAHLYSQRKAVLEQEIAQHKLQVGRLAQQQSQVTPEIDEQKTIHLIADLERIAADQRTAGLEVDPELVQRITQLRSTLREQKTVQIYSSARDIEDQLLQTRSRVAVLCRTWADQLEKQCAAKQAARDLIVDIVQREQQKFADRVVERGFTACINALRAYATTVDQGTEVLRRYAAVFERLSSAHQAGGLVDKDLQGAFVVLQKQAYPILTANRGIPDVTLLWRTSYPEMQQFCQDLASDDAYYSQLGQRLTDAIYDVVIDPDYKDIWTVTCLGLSYWFAPDLVLVLSKYGQGNDQFIGG